MRKQSNVYIRLLYTYNIETVSVLQYVLYTSTNDIYTIVHQIKIYILTALVNGIII